MAQQRNLPRNCLHTIEVQQIDSMHYGATRSEHVAVETDKEADPQTDSQRDAVQNSTCLWVVPGDENQEKNIKHFRFLVTLDDIQQLYSSLRSD